MIRRQCIDTYRWKDQKGDENEKFRLLLLGLRKGK